MRISDWSSDVCSSDLRPEAGGGVKAWHAVTYHQHLSGGRTRWALRPGQPVRMANGELLSALVNRAVENEGCQTLALSIHSSDGWTRIADAEFELGGVAQLGGYQAVHLSTHFDDFGRAQLVEVLLTPAATKVTMP